MFERLAVVAELAAATDAVVSARQLDALGVPKSTRNRWVRSGVLVRLGPRSFVVGGAPSTWERRVRAGVIDLAPDGVAAGRTAARLHGLDGFAGAERIELLVPRSRRHLVSRHLVRSTSIGWGPGDIVHRGGIRALSPERLILDAPLFAFRRREVEGAIDSALRLQRTTESRLRGRVEQRLGMRLPGHQTLVDALIDSGGHSFLERSLLELLRAAGLPRPQLQRVFRDKGRTVARVDAYFPGGLVVEVAGHATHSTRRQRQHDEQRRTELILRGETVITFTYDDLDERLQWVATMIAAALAAIAAG